MKKRQSPILPNVARSNIAVTYTVLLVVALCLSGRGLATTEDDASPSWFAQAPRTEDGRFTNVIGELFRGGARVRLPFLWGRLKVVASPRDGEAPRVASGTAHFRAATRPTPNEPTVTWIGHATVLVEMDGVRFLTDPMWSKRASPLSFMGPARLVEPGIALKDLPPIDFAMISHNHYDHMDLPTLEALAEINPEITYYVPLGNAELLRSRGLDKVVELDWTDSIEHDGVTVHCLPAQHWSKRSLGDDLEALWSSWAVVGPSRRFYFAGDTGYFDGFAEIGERLGPFDLAALPIGAYTPTELMRLTHMDPEQAVRAGLDLRARRALAVHFGTFDLADEPLDEPPKRFIAEAARQDPVRLPAWVFAVGEFRRF